MSPEKPLDLARIHKELKEGLQPPRKLSRFVGNDTSFIEFLRKLLGVEPRPARAENVGLILERHLALENGYQKLVAMSWGRSKGGYRVPTGELCDFASAATVIYILFSKVILNILGKSLRSSMSSKRLEYSLLWHQTMPVSSSQASSSSARMSSNGSRTQMVSIRPSLRACRQRTSRSTL